MKVPSTLRVAFVLGIIGLGQASCAPQHIGTAYGTKPNFDCTIERSVPLDFDRFLTVPGSFSEKCVHARGYIVGSTFFESLDSFYASRSETFPIGQIGLYERPSSEPTSQRRYVDLTAFAFTCRQRNRIEERDRERETAEAKSRGNILVTADDSFCAFAKGDVPILYISEARDVPNAPMRLFGPEAEDKYGTLISIEEHWLYAAEVRNLVTEWIDAARTRRIDYWHVDRADIPTLMDSKTSPIAFLLGATIAPQITYFRAKQPTGSSAYEAYGCVCRLDSCEGQWPIIADDATLAKSWPYICLQVVRDAQIAGEKPFINYILE